MQFYNLVDCNECFFFQYKQFIIKSKFNYYTTHYLCINYTYNFGIDILKQAAIEEFERNR